MKEIEIVGAVLILILMEYALRANQPYVTPEEFKPVLILILMEYALREGDILEIAWSQGGLNPYSNGICSKSRR